MDHTEPKLGWSRFAGLCALLHAFYYTLTAGDVQTSVLYFDGFVVACWLLGGNGRAALVDAIRAKADK